MKHYIKTRSEAGTTTAEYAVCTGGAVGFAGVLLKLLTSDTGQTLINTIFTRITHLLPF